MFCTQCGTRNLDTDQFCRNCSHPLVRPRATEQAPPRHAPAQQPPPYPNYQGYPPPAPYNPPMAIQGAKASTQAITALVLSLISFISCCFPVGIIGLVLGKIELNAIREGRAPQAGEAFAKWGFYLGIASLALAGFLSFFGFLADLLR
jgi:Domain of unknown function (DUF4190)/zinc-ribbon domain